MRDAVMGALGGGAVGLVAGFVVAVVVLQLRRVRNGVLIRRGEPPYRDLVLPPLAVPGGGLGVVLGGGFRGCCRCRWRSGWAAARGRAWCWCCVRRWPSCR